MKSSEPGTGHARADAAIPERNTSRRSGTGLALRWTTALLALFMFYLLSYGPVRRVFVVRGTQRIPAGNGFPETVVQTSSRPTWVTWLYGPASSLSRTGIGKRLYVPYLRWWDAKPAHGASLVRSAGAFESDDAGSR